MTTSYHPSLLILAKTVGFSYLETTEVLGVKNVAPASSDQSAESSTDLVEADGEPPPQEKELLEYLERVDPGQKPRKGLRDTQKEFAYHEDGYKNIASVFEHSNAQDIADYKDWYKQANADCVQLAEKLKAAGHLNDIPIDPVRLVIGVVAATSQGTLWEDNIELAANILITRKLPANQDLKLTEQNREKVMKIVNNDFSVLSTDKFGAFFESIIDPEATSNTVVVDTHAAAMWLGKRLGAQDPFFQKNRPQGARLAAIVRDYTKLAQKVGYSPQSVQAVTWSVWRKLPPGYESKFMQYEEESVHPEVSFFKALYPFLYAKLNPASKTSNWRWRFSRFNDILRPENMNKDEWDLVKDQYEELMPHHTPEEWRQAVQKFGKNLYQYYGFPKDAWDAFMKAYPNFGQGLEQVRRQNLAAMFDAIASRIKP